MVTGAAAPLRPVRPPCPCPRPRPRPSRGPQRDALFHQPPRAVRLSPALLPAPAPRARTRPHALTRLAVLRAIELRQRCAPALARVGAVELSDLGVDRETAWRVLGAVRVGAVVELSIHR